MAGRTLGRWLYVVILIPPLAAGTVVFLAPEPDGHWLDHLSSVGLRAAVIAVLLLLTTLLGWRRTPPLLLAALAVVVVGIIAQTIGDYRVAESLWRTSGDRGFGDGYEEGHDLAALGDLIVMGGGLAFAIAAGMRRWVAPRWAVAAAIMVVIPPPFLWPGAGLLLLQLHQLRSDERREASLPTHGEPASR